MATVENAEVEGPPQRLWSTPSWLVNQVASRSYRLVSRALRGRSANPNQFALLSALEEFGAASQASLGRRLGMDRSDVVAGLDELQGRGLVDRSPDERDRRRNAVTLTREGRRELMRLAALVDNAQTAAFESLSDAERAQLQRLLRRMVESHPSWG